MIAACLLCLGLFGWMQRQRFLGGVNDFAQLYCGATLVGTPSLYSPEANREIHRKTMGVVIRSVYYSRPPFYAFFLKPLAWLPYLQAYWVFQAISASCIAWYLWAFARDRLEIALFASIYPPLMTVLLGGQDVGIVLALAGAGCLLMEKDRPFLAGLAWSLCAIKPHLVLLVPVALVVYRQWRVLAGGVAGGAALTLISFGAQGRDWVRDYAALLRNPELHPSPEIMPNLQPLRLALGPSLPDGWVLPAAILIALLATVGIRRVGHWGLAIGLAIPASLAISYHAYVQDTLLLLLPLGLFLRHGAPPAMVRFAALIVTPILPVMGLMGVPWSAAYAVYIAAWMAFAAFLPAGEAEGNKAVAPAPVPG